MPDKNTQTYRKDKMEISCYTCKGWGLVKVDTIYCDCHTPARYGCYVCQGRGFLKSGYDTCEKCWGDGLCKIEDP